MKLSRPILWFVGCAILLLFGFGRLFAGEMWIFSFGAIIAGFFGMITSLILAFRKKEIEQTQIPVKKTKFVGTLTTASLAHAGIVSLMLFLAFEKNWNPNSFLIYSWWTILAIWPIWIIPFLMFGWSTNRIMVTMIIGLIILSPALFILLIAASMGHGC